ncbi:MAG: Mobile element protein [Myxococcaceae bacterium]|nr:Mobile element protein [Myxococcaceae bacterium]
MHHRLRGIYGSPRIHRELRAKGHRIGKRRVEGRMRLEGLKGRQKRRLCRTTHSNHSHPIAPNVLERDFATDVPNEVWVADVTLSALAALTAALRSRQPRSGLVHHSDRGSPYASDDYRDALRLRGIVASMSRKGDCWDNAVAESFFATLRAEHVDHERFATRAAPVASPTDYIDGLYNTVRRHSYLGYVSTIEFELKRLSR